MKGDGETQKAGLRECRKSRLESEGTAKSEKIVVDCLIEYAVD